MSPDSQRLEIEQARRRLADWQVEQPDYHFRLRRVVGFWFRPAMDTLSLSARDLVDAVGSVPGADALRNIMREQAFELIHNGESMLHRYANGPGQHESGLCYRYLRRLADTEVSLWAVVDVKSGAWLKVSPLAECQTLMVHDRIYSRDCEAGDLLVGRVIDMPAGPTFGEGVLNIGNPAWDSSVSASVDLVRHLLSWSVVEVMKASRKAAAAGNCPSAGRNAPPHSSAAGPDSASASGSRPGASTGTGSGGPSRSVDQQRPADPLPSGIDRERLLERIRKLFSMAQQAEASPHEAEIALRRCQSLMAKYGISEADLETSAFGNVEFTQGRTVPMHVKYLAVAVAKLHEVLFVTGSGGFAEFRGYEVDANVARLTLDYLLDAVERALAQRKRAGDFPAGRSAAYDYRMGFVMEVNRRVEQLVAERRKAQQQAAGTGTALTIRKMEIVDRECGKDLRSSSFRGRGARDAIARAAGQTDGAKVSLDQQVESNASSAALSDNR